MEEVYNFIKKDIELKPDDIIVIGVSGGPDSMALLYIMNEFKNKIGFKIVCAHVNHNKRIESEQEKIDLENYCKENDIIFEYIISVTFSINFIFYSIPFISPAF